MNLNTTISSISSDRWLEYKDLWLEALQESPYAYATSYQEQHQAPQKKWEQRLQGQNSLMIFSQDEQKLIGLVGAYWEEKTKTAHIANIVSVYLKPEYRNQGIGRRLLESIIGESRQQPHITKLKIGVNPTQISALALYHKLGFRVVGELQNELHVQNQYYSEYLMEMLIK